MGLTPPLAGSKCGEPGPVKKRLGIFGGAFDPPHLGHVALARAAIDQFELDTLHIIPTGQAWHKARTLSAAAHRLAMARLAFDGVAQACVDERELQRAGPTFTIDTLETLQAEFPAAQLYLFIGADQFEAFGQWHRWQDVAAIAIICIAGRADIDWAAAPFDAQKVLQGRIRPLALPEMPVSATQVRQLAAAGADIFSQVPPAVARYISFHQLYQSFQP